MNFPFKFYCQKVIPLAFDESMSYYEVLCALTDYIKNTLLPAVNENADAVAELQNLYIELKQYVDDYFSDLNVQTQINNKLDQMAEDGTLAEIINEEIFTELNNQVVQNTSDIQTLEKYKLYVDVNAEGIENDGTNCTAKLQNLINTYPNGTTFFFKNGTYLFKNIELPSNTTILGDTNTKFIIDDDQINRQFILSNVNNIKFKNCYFQNGTTNEQDLIGAAADLINVKSCILLNNCSNIIIDECIFDTISGAAFIWCLNSEYLYLKNSILKNSAYGMLTLISNCKNFYVENNIFENAYTGSTGNTYFISTGVQNYETDSGYTDGLYISNNIFKNNIGWEAVDSHGGKNITIENNKFYECYQPITLFDDNRPTRVFNMENINIINNYIEVNEGIDNYKGYAILCHGNSTTNKQVKQLNIENNTIISTIGNGCAGISIRYVNGSNVKNNFIQGVHYYALNCVQIINGSLENNTMYNCVSINTDIRTTDISILNCYNFNIQNNKSTSNDLPYYALNISGKSGLCIGNNDLQGITSSSNGELYHGIGFDIVKKMGDTELNQNYPYRRATNYLPQSRSSSNVCTFKTTTNSNIVETSVNILTVIGINENVEIVGAGVNGDNIQAQVVDFIDKSHVKLSKAMYQTLNAAQVNTLDCTFTSL